MVVGFWLRLVTDSLDAIFLGIFGYLIIIVPFRKIVYDLGDAGVLIGLGVAFLYFGLLQSSFGNGQSLAKKIFKFQVLRMDGSYMPLPVSFLRYLVIAFIFYGTAIAGFFSPQLEYQIVPIFVFFALFACLILGTIILVAFHPLKRGLHDLIAGSVVVRLGSYDKANLELLANPQRAKKAYVAVAIVGVLVMLGSWILVANVMSTPTAYITQEEAVELKTIAARLEKETVFDDVVITPTEVMITFGSGETETEIRFTLLAVEARLFPLLPDEEKFMDLQKAIGFIVQEFTYLAYYDCISFVTNLGFNIGIVSFDPWVTHEFTTAGTPVVDDPHTVRLLPLTGSPPTRAGCHLEREAIGYSDQQEQEGLTYRVLPMVPRPLDER